MTVSTGEALAHRRPRAADRRRPAADPRAGPRARSWRDLPTMGYIGNPLDPWGAADAGDGLRRRLRGDRRVGRLRRPRARPRLPVPLAAVRGRDRQRRHAASSSAATRDRPEILPVYVSLTSGEPPPETKAVLDAAGGGAPLLRGARRGVPGDRRGSPAGSAGASGRLANGPWRPAWPALAADRTSLRRRPGAARSRSRREPARRRVAGPVRAREPRAPPGGRRPGRSRPSPPPDADAAVAVGRGLGGPVALKLDAAGLAHKSDVGGVAPRACVDDDAIARGRRGAPRASAGDRGLAVRGAARRADGRPAASS